MKESEIAALGRKKYRQLKIEKLPYEGLGLTVTPVQKASGKERPERLTSYQEGGTSQKKLTTAIGSERGK